MLVSEREEYDWAHTAWICHRLALGTWSGQGAAPKFADCHPLRLAERRRRDRDAAGGYRSADETRALAAALAARQA